MAEGLRRAASAECALRETLEAGLQIALGGTAQLDDAGACPRATVRQAAAHRGSRIATPSGRLHCQPRKRTVADSVFCAMKISSTIRIRKPGISADHSAAALVNLTGDSRAVADRGGAASDGRGVDRRRLGSPGAGEHRRWPVGRHRGIAGHGSIFALSGE